MKHYIKNSLFFLIFSLIMHKASADCFMIKDLESNTIIKKEGNCEKRVAPCSSFKIPLALIGFETGILKNAKEPVWDFKTEYENAYHVCLDKWKAPHTPSSWMQNSCIWYSQVLTQKLEIAKLQQFVNEFNYGNKDLSGDKGKDNGLTHSWLSSSLKISPKEQVEFIAALLTNKLPVSGNAISLTKEILFVNNIKQWKLFGKTGSGYQLDSKGNYNKDKQLGWFVGWLENPMQNKHYVVVYLLEDERPEKIVAGLRAKEQLISKINAKFTE